MRQITPFIVFFCCCFQGSGAFAQQQSLRLVPFRSGDLWGYADTKGKMVVPPQFEEAYPFLHQLQFLESYFSPEYQKPSWPTLKHPIAVVKKDGLFGLLGADGKLLCAPVANTIFEFVPEKHGTFWVRYNNNASNLGDPGVFKNALLCEGGAKLTPFDYTFYDDDPGCGYGEYAPYIPFLHPDFSDFLIIKKGEKQGLISIHGKEIYPPVWSHLVADDQGFAMAYSNIDTIALAGYSGSGYYLLNPKNQIVKKLPEYVSYFSGYVGKGYWLGRDRNGRICLFNRAGDFIKKVPYTEFFGFNKLGLAAVQDTLGRWLIINADLNQVVELPDPSRWQKDSSAYWIQEQDLLWYQYDSLFQRMKKHGYPSVPGQIDLCKKRYFVYSDNKGSWVYEQGKTKPQSFDFLVYDPKGYDEDWLKTTKQQYLKTDHAGKAGIIDCQFRVIVPAKFQHVALFHDREHWIVQENQKSGLYNSSQQRLVLPTAFDAIELSDSDPKTRLDVRVDKYWGQYDLEGKEIFPAIYEQKISQISRMCLLKSQKGWHLFDAQQNEISSFSLPEMDANTLPNIYFHHLTGNDTLGITFTVHGKNGMCNKWGQLMIPPDYDRFWVQDEYILAVKDQKHGVLLYPELCEFISFNYDHILYFEGKFRLQKSKNGREVIFYDPKTGVKNTYASPLYPNLGWISEGRIGVSKNCLFGFLDEQLKEVIPLQYNNAWGFSNGLAAVQLGNKRWGFINRDGKMVIQPQYLEVESFRNGKSRVLDTFYRRSILNPNGEVLITAQNIERNGRFFTITIDSARQTVLDADLKPVLDTCVIVYRDEFKGDLFYIQNGQAGYLAPSGVKSDATAHFNYQTYPNGLMGVNFYGYWGLQDAKGKWLIPLMAQWANESVNGQQFVIRRPEKDGLYDQHGQLIIPLLYDQIRIKGDFCIVHQNGLLGVYDLKGKLIVPAKFAEIEILPSVGLIKVITKEQKVGFFDMAGRQYFQE